MRPRPDIISRILESILKLSSSSAPISADEISQLALVSREEARKILRLLEVGEGAIMGENERVELVLNALRLGVDASPLARYLGWREFEKLTTALLNEAGYDAEWDVKLSFRGKRVQVDVLALKGSILLVIDCKRWNRPLTPSIEQEIKSRLEMRLSLLKDAIERAFGAGSPENTYLIPATISLYRPSSQIIDGFIFTSIGELGGALEFVERAFFQLRNERVSLPRGLMLRELTSRLRALSR